MDLISDNDNVPWYCLVCTIRENIQIFPFALQTETDLENINQSNAMGMSEILPKFETLSEVSKFNSLNMNDVNINLMPNIDCNYYSVDHLYTLLERNQKYFNILHANVCGLETNYDNLYSFLSEAPTDFDVINITETSQNVNENVKRNVTIEGYELYSTPSNTNMGGTSIYVKRAFLILLKDLTWIFYIMILNLSE